MWLEVLPPLQFYGRICPELVLFLNIWENSTTNTSESGVFLNIQFSSVQFSHSVVSNSAAPGLQHPRLPCPSRTPRAYSNCQRLLKLMSTESVMPSNQLILCHLLLLLPSIFPSIRICPNSSSHQVAKVLELQLQCQSFQ